jgi:hypothetical protein
MYMQVNQAHEISQQLQNSQAAQLLQLQLQIQQQQSNLYQNQRAQAQLQQQQLQQQLHQQQQQNNANSNASPTANQNASRLPPADIQQTNNALAQQLAMLTLMNNLKKSADVAVGAPPASGSGGGGGMGGVGVVGSGVPGYGSNLSSYGALGLGIGLPAGLALNGPGSGEGSNASVTTSSPKTDPLHNPHKYASHIILPRGVCRYSCICCTISTSNVYINNLPAAFTETHLHQLCAGFGPIISVRMMLRETGTCYGFVL